MANKRSINIPAPTVPESEKGWLAAETSQATVIIQPYELMAAGDRVDMYWTGDESGEYDDYVTISAAGVGYQLLFTVPASEIASNKSVNVKYTVSYVDGETVESEALTLQIGEQPLLPAPTVEESEKGRLAVEASQATVVIQSYELMAAGDRLDMNWTGDQSGEYGDYDLISKTEVGESQLFTVPASEIASNKSVTVTYTVSYVGGEQEESEALTLPIRWFLPPPTVAESANGWLAAETSKATVNIAPYEEMAVGDNVQLTWVGDVSGEFQDSLPLSIYTVNQTIPFKVSAANIAPNRSAQVSYLVERGSGFTDTSEVLTLVIATLPDAPTIDEAENGVIEVTSLGSTGATARIPASAALQAGDGAILYWTGTTLESYTQIVTGKQAGSSLAFAIPLSVIQGDSGKSITLTYDVVRTDNTTDNSPPSLYEVHASDIAPLY